MSTSTVIGGELYRQLALPWLPDLLHDQRVGGGLAWATGELPMLLVIITLLVRWSRDDEREAARRDRRTDAADAELRAYNEMLARLAGADTAPGGWLPTSAGAPAPPDDVFPGPRGRT